MLDARSSSMIFVAAITLGCRTPKPPRPIESHVVSENSVIKVKSDAEIIRAGGVIAASFGKKFADAAQQLEAKKVSSVCSSRAAGSVAKYLRNAWLISDESICKAVAACLPRERFTSEIAMYLATCSFVSVEKFRMPKGGVKDIDWDAALQLKIAQKNELLKVLERFDSGVLSTILDLKANHLSGEKADIKSRVETYISDISKVYPNFADRLAERWIYTLRSKSQFYDAIDFAERYLETRPVATIRGIGLRDIYESMFRLGKAGITGAQAIAETLISKQ